MQDPLDKQNTSWHRPLKYASFILIVLVSLLAKGQHISHNLPYLYESDEYFNYTTIQRMIATQSVQELFYPPLSYYIQLLPYVGYSHLDDSIIPDSQAFSSVYIEDPQILIKHRLLSLFADTMSLILIFFLVRHLTNSTLFALSGMLFYLSSPIAYRMSWELIPDVWIPPFVLATLFFSIRIGETGKMKWYIFAAITAALSAGVKYNAAPIVVAIAAGHFYYYGWRGIFNARIYVAAGATILTVLLILAPYLAEPSQLIARLTDLASRYSNNLVHFNYYEHLFSVQILVTILNVIAFVAIFFNKRYQKLRIILTFVITFFIFIIMFPRHSPRNLYVLLVAMFVVAAAVVSFIVADVSGTNSGQRRKLSAIVLLPLLVLGLAVPYYHTWQTRNHWLQRDYGYEQAGNWLDTNLEVDSYIYKESYSPYLNPEKYDIHNFSTRLNFDMLINENFDYLVMSTYHHNRYLAPFEELENYRGRVLQQSQENAIAYQSYQMVFRVFPEIQRFTTDSRNNAIVVLQAPPPLDETPDLIFDGNLELLSYEIPGGQETFQACESIPVLSWWRTNVPLESDYHISSIVLNESGEALVQIDEALTHIPTYEWVTGEIYRYYVELPIPCDAENNEYALYLTLYTFVGLDPVNQLEFEGLENAQVSYPGGQPFGEYGFLRPIMVSENLNRDSD